MATRRPLALVGGSAAELPAGDTLPPAIVAPNPTTQTANYTAVSGDLVLANALGGGFTVTLPSSGVVEVKRTDVNAAAVVTIAAPSGMTVGSLGATSFPLRLTDQSIVFQASGTNWIVSHGHLSLSALDNRYRQPTCFDDFTSKANGTLAGTRSDSGHLYSTSVWTTAYSDAPVIYNGALGPPSTHDPGGPSNDQITAGYAYLQPGGTVGWVGANVRFDASDGNGAMMIICALDRIGVTNSAGAGSMHLAFSPWSAYFSVFDTGADSLQSIYPDGYDTNQPRFPVALPCDGTTTTRVDCIIDQPRGTCYVIIGDLPILTYRHPLIRTIQATYAVWEPWEPGNAVNTNIARCTKVWADSVTGIGSGVGAQTLANAIASAGPGRGGAGLPGLTASSPTNAVARPSSRMRHGSAWTDIGFSTTLSAGTAANATTFTCPWPIAPGTLVAIDGATSSNAYLREARTTTAVTGSAAPYTVTVPALSVAHSSGATVVVPPRTAISDGNFWRAPDGTILGNRLDQNTAQAHLDATGAATIGSSVVRVSRPTTAFRTPGVYKLTCTTAGTIAIYAITPVEAGQPFFAGAAQVLAGGTSRSVTSTIRYYTNANAQVGSDVVTAAQTVTSATPLAFLTAPAIAPSTAVAAAVLVTVASAAVGDVFYITDLMLGWGPIPTHMRT